MDKVVPLWDAIVATLKDMGSASIREGKPYGLRGYPDYHRELFPGSFRKSAWEEPLTEGIKLGLRQRRFDAATERFYPAGGKCDLVVNLGGSETIWIECKTAFRQHLGPPEMGSDCDYNYGGENCYDPGRGRDSWVAGVSDIALKDIPKLLTLQSATAAYIGVLLLGFDRVSSPLTNQELYHLLPPQLGEWTAAHGSKEGLSWPDGYPVRKDLGFRERVWFWYCPVRDREQIPRVSSQPSMSESDSDEARRQALLAVKRFCAVPYKQHGTRQKSGAYAGWYRHDWGHLVQQINKLYQRPEISIPFAWEIGNQVRRRFKNVSNWNVAVNIPGVHEEILGTILRGLA